MENVHKLRKKRQFWCFIKPWTPCLHACCTCPSSYLWAVSNISKQAKSSKLFLWVCYKIWDPTNTSEPSLNLGNHVHLVCHIPSLPGRGIRDCDAAWFWMFLKAAWCQTDLGIPFLLVYLMLSFQASKQNHQRLVMGYVSSIPSFDG